MSQEQPKVNVSDFIGFGSEVDQFQDMEPGLGNYAKDVEDKFIEIFKSRAIPNTGMRTVELGTGALSDKKPYIIIEQTIGTGAKASSAVNISKYGTQDLQIERRHFEQGLIVTAAKTAERAAEVTIGYVLVGAGILLSFVGIGLCVIPIGIIFIIIGFRKDKSQSNLVGGQRNESVLLMQAVDASLKEAIQFVKTTKA